MTDPTDPRAVADDPSGIVQQMPEFVILPDPKRDLNELADLRADVERLRAALAQLACRQNWDGYEWVGSGFTGRHIARAALSPETDGGQDGR